MKKILFVLVALGSNEIAASTAIGTIENMIIGREGHQVFIHLKDAPQTCGSDHTLGFNYAYSLTGHPAGKEILSALLAAQIAKKQITIQGSGTCSLDSNMEDLGYVYTH